VEREMHGRLCRQFADAEINGEGTNPAFFRLGMLGIIKGEGTMPDGPAGSGRKVSCADEGNRMSRGGGRTLRVASAEMAWLACDTTDDNDRAFSEFELAVLVVVFPCTVAFFELGILILQCFDNHWSFSGRQHKDWSKYYKQTIVLWVNGHDWIQLSRLSEEKWQKRRNIMVNYKNVANVLFGPSRILTPGPARGVWPVTTDRNSPHLDQSEHWQTPI
jgi:hypothetical protein